MRAASRLPFNWWSKAQDRVMENCGVFPTCSDLSGAICLKINLHLPVRRAKWVLSLVAGHTMRLPQPSL
jgi:hypothetical protein